MNRIADWLAGENGQHHQSIVVAHASFIRVATVHAVEAAPQSFWRIDIVPLLKTRFSDTVGRWNLSSVGCTMPTAK